MSSTARYKLTIAVPTFNRSAFLQATLNTLIAGVEHLRDVQILVSDNASTDDTEQVCRQYGRESNFKYLRNSSNVGFDGNYQNCIDGADAEYVWVMGDDDCIVPGAIESVLHYIEDSQPSMIVLNGASNGRNRIEKTAGVVEYTSFDHFFGDYGYHFTWISTTILRKAALKPLALQEKERSDGFIHLALQLKSFLEDGKFLLDFKPLIYTADNVADYSRDLKKVAHLFAHSLCNIVDMHSEKLSKTAVRSFLFGHHDHFNMFGGSYFIKARARKSFTPEEFNSMLPKFKRVTRKWRTGILIYSLPKPVFKLVSRLKIASK